MINLYIDESGSLTELFKNNKYFIISIIKVNNKKQLERNFKRFVSENMNELLKIDTNNKMFLNGKFHELKGCALTPALKRKFVKYILKNNCFEIFYIKVDNSMIDSMFLDSKARSFNYLLKLFLIKNLHDSNLIDDEIFLHIDERNIKTNAKYTCMEYLNTELILEEQLLTYPLNVKYYDSANNKFIQIADIFANLYYSELMTGNYTDIFEELQQGNYLKSDFIFPLKPKLKKFAINA